MNKNDSSNIRQTNEYRQKHISTYMSLAYTINCCLGAFFFGYQQGVLNLTQQSIQQIYQITSEQYFWIQLVGPLSAIIGALLCGFLIEQYSRRQSFLIIDTLGIVSLLLNLKRQLISLFGFRILSGIVVGMNSMLVPVYISEISPASLQGLNGSMNQVFINVGIIFSCIFSLKLNILQNLEQTAEIIQEESDWLYFVLMMPIITCVIRIVIFQTLDKNDSPINNLMQGNDTLLNRYLNMFYQKKYITDAKENIKYKLFLHNLSLKKVFCEQTYRKMLIVGVGVALFNVLSGINTLVFFSANIYSLILGDYSIKDIDNINFILTTLNGIILMLTAIISGFLMKNYSYKKIFQISLAVCGGALFVVFVLLISYPEKQKSLILTLFIFFFIYVFVISFGLGTGPIPWLFNAQIQPQKIVAITSAANWVACSLNIIIVNPLQLSLINIGIAMLIFSLINIMGFFFVKHQMIDTRNLQVKDIIYKYTKNQVNLNASQLKEQSSLNREQKLNNNSYKQ